MEQNGWETVRFMFFPFLSSKEKSLNSQAIVKTRGLQATTCSPELNSHWISADTKQHSSSIATVTNHKKFAQWVYGKCYGAQSKHSSVKGEEQV